MSQCRQLSHYASGQLFHKKFICSIINGKPHPKQTLSFDSPAAITTTGTRSIKLINHLMSHSRPSIFSIDYQPRRLFCLNADF